jgi:hypothetical protein
MRLLPVLLLVLALAPSRAAAQDRYTRDELERMSREQLVEAVLHLQAHGRIPPRSSCSSFDPLSGGSGQLLTKLRNPGYDNDGTLRWPDGGTFLKRHSGYDDDRGLYYPNAARMVLAHPGYDNDKTLYWPNGNVLLKRHSGYDDDGTIYRADGSVWLRRHSGYNDDRQRYGLPMENYEAGDLKVRAQLAPDDSVTLSMIQRGRGWRVRVDVDPAKTAARVTECLDNNDPGWDWGR